MTEATLDTAVKVNNIEYVLQETCACNLLQLAALLNILQNHPEIQAKASGKPTIDPKDNDLRVPVGIWVEQGQSIYFDFFEDLHEEMERLGHL